MDKETSMRISAGIGRIIAESAPRIKYTPADLRRAERALGKKGLTELREIGPLSDDFELYYVIHEFCSRIGLGDAADGEYIIELFKNAARLDPEEFEKNSYIASVKPVSATAGDITLTTAKYSKGEIFQYDMPSFSAKAVIPCLGFFDRGVSFPTIYQGDIPWMSVCPSEINSMKRHIDAARGRVLVLGLGLGYYPFMISLMERVESIVIVELQQNVVDLFRAHILPFFEHKDKIKVITADAIDFLGDVNDGDYDFCFADIWEGAVDGAAMYKKILPHEKRLRSTTFAYWIEEQIRAYLDQ